MLHVFRDLLKQAQTQLRTDPRQRLIGLILALLIEAGLVLVVLSLGWTDHEPNKPAAQLVSVAIEEKA